MADLVINPVTRINGNASVRIFMDETGNPLQASFQAFGYRGFEQFAEGAHIDNLLPIVSRICGGDSIFHQIAAAKAVEKALGVEPPQGARHLRELAMWGQLFERHAVSLTVHSLPDLLFPSSDPGLRSIVSIHRVDEEVVRKVMALKSLGTFILREAGGKPVHPVNFLPGGAISDMPEEKKKALAARLDDARPLLIETGRLMKLLLRRNEDAVNALGTLPTSYLSLKGADGIELNTDSLRPVDADGNSLGDYAPEAAVEAIKEDNSAYSHIKSVEFSGVGEVRVGPLARLNVNQRYGSEQADEELEEVKSQWGFPLHKSMISHVARILEMIHAWERMKDILSGTGGETLQSELKPRAGSGVGVVEAPEGTLLYRLELSDEGLVKRLSIIAPLQFNIRAMESSLLESARAVLGGVEADDKAAILLETAVRAYAPCVPCGVH
jgi:coenzyme F420-reducing hydrogenase alpha subunit